jgi:hypothetical protein
MQAVFAAASVVTAPGAWSVDASQARCQRCPDFGGALKKIGDRTTPQTGVGGTFEVVDNQSRRKKDYTATCGEASSPTKTGSERTGHRSQDRVSRRPTKL